MLKVFKHMTLLALLLLTGSCSELYEVGELVDIENVTMSRHEADLLVGDTLMLEARLSPEASTASLLWTVNPSSHTAVRLVGRKVWGTSPGQALVKVEAFTNTSVQTDGEVPGDTCLIHVFDWQRPDHTLYPLETVVISTFQLNGTDLTADLGDVLLVVTVHGEVRGWAEPKEAYGIPYLQFRIYSETYGEPAVIECYSKQFYRRIPLADLVLDGERHGTLSDPLRLIH